MNKKKLLIQMELFDEITSAKLTPNQYYLLCCMRDSVTPLQMNLHLELRHLVSTGWVEEVEGTPRLTPQAITLVNKIEGMFKLQKKKTAIQAMGTGYEEKIKEYISLFPSHKLPSGKFARTAPKNCEKAFKWFFENHDHKWETVIKATTMYIQEYQLKNWKYMRTSQYFIRKQEPDRTFNSELANYCMLVESGGRSTVQKPAFTTKVV